MLSIQYQKVDNELMAYSIFGKEQIDLVIEMGLGACMGEWWHIAQKLSVAHTVLLYERLGCGSSQKSNTARTPVNIAGELYNFLETLPHKNKITILAHSQGGLYAQQFTRLYPDLVEKLILLDPLSANDNRFKSELSKREYKKSGVDKRSGLYINLILARLHLGKTIKGFMREAPPFYYFNDFSADATEYILNCLTQPKVYTTALEESQNSHNADIISELKSQNSFPQIPIRLITHSSELETKEIMEFGGLQYEEAQKIESIWQKIMQDYLLFSNDAELYEAKNSSHYIHLTDLDLISEVVSKNIGMLNKGIN